MALNKEALINLEEGLVNGRLPACTVLTYT